jgi:hypothetical protein
LQESDDESTVDSESFSGAENSSEQKLIKMYRKLPESHKYKILGYVERV